MHRNLAKIVPPAQTTSCLPAIYLLTSSVSPPRGQLLRRKTLPIETRPLPCSPGSLVFSGDWLHDKWRFPTSEAVNGFFSALQQQFHERNFCSHYSKKQAPAPPTKVFKAQAYKVNV